MTLLEIMDQAILFGFAFLSTLFASVSGGGSGFIQFPLLIFMGLSFATALGTHKIAIVFVGIGAMAKQKLPLHSLRKDASLLLLLIGSPAVVLGTWIVVNIDEYIAKLALGILIALFGIYSLVKKDFGSRHEVKNLTRARLLATLTIFASGVLSGSLSSGSGIFVTLTLTLILGLDLKTAIMHTMIFVSTLWNGIGAITVGMVSPIYWAWLPALIIGSFLGAYVGTALLIKLPLKAVRIIFALVAIASGLALIYTVIA